MSYLPRISQVFADAAFSPEELAYYARHLLLPGVGTVGQQKLKSARVLVVGAGGLGCPLLQALAGAGVGQLTVVDGDSVALSNLSRQWLHRSVDVGRNKAESAAEKLRELNPFIAVDGRAVWLEASNAKDLIESHDLLVDATDDLDVRYLIDEVCAECDRPWVHAALYRESSQLCVFWAKWGARFVDLFPQRSAAPSCAGAGMLGASASVAGHLQALEVVKLITGQAGVKLGEVVSLQAQQHRIQSFRLPGVREPELIADAHLSRAAHAWSLDDYRQALSIGQAVRILDLRAAALFAAGSLPDAESCSAESILEQGLEVAGGSTILLVCEAGLVSALLADALRSRGLANVYHLEGGMGREVRG